MSIQLLSLQRPGELLSFTRYFSFTLSSSSVSNRKLERMDPGEFARSWKGETIDAQRHVRISLTRSRRSDDFFSPSSSSFSLLFVVEVRDWDVERLMLMSHVEEKPFSSLYPQGLWFSLTKRAESRGRLHMDYNYLGGFPFEWREKLGFFCVKWFRVVKGVEISFRLLIKWGYEKKTFFSFTSSLKTKFVKKNRCQRSERFFFLS